MPLDRLFPRQFQKACCNSKRINTWSQQMVKKLLQKSYDGATAS